MIWAMCAIALVDLALSGDNALVIGVAAAHLPRRARLVAIACGGTGAILLRVALTAVASLLLALPALEVAGAFLVEIVALRLLFDDGRQSDEPRPAGRSVGEAARLIIVADATMSLDNVLAVGALARGNVLALALGLLASIALLCAGAALVAELARRCPWLVDLAAVVLAATAAGMAARGLPAVPQVLFYVVFLGVVSVAELVLRARRARKRQEGMRHTIPVQPEAHVVDGFYDANTGELRIQLDLPTAIEGAKNTALVVDASGSMDGHFRRPLFGGGLSGVEKFIHAAGRTISELDSDHAVSVYLCCLGDGTQVQALGNLERDALEALRIDRNTITLGGGTYLLPALRQVVKEVVVDSGCAYGLIALVTDGKFNDFASIVSWATSLAQQIEAGTHPLTKIVLIGFDDADAAQLEALDNLETGTSIDIFNALSVATLEDAMQMLDSEAITGDLVIAPSGSLEVNGQTVATFEAGLPQRIDATIPPSQTKVTVVVAGEDGAEPTRLEVALV